MEYKDKPRRALGMRRRRVHWGRTEAANRFAYNFKFVFMMTETGQPEVDRDCAYMVQELVSHGPQRDEFAINGQRRFAAV